MTVENTRYISVIDHEDGRITTYRIKARRVRVLLYFFQGLHENCDILKSMKSVNSYLYE